MSYRFVDVLNMKMADIKNWQWDAGEEGLPVEPRRQLNGKYRIMMDEDILDAIFLHYVGMTWNVGMKTILCDVARYTGIRRGSDQGRLRRHRPVAGHGSGDRQPPRHS